VISGTLITPNHSHWSWIRWIQMIVYMLALQRLTLDMYSILNGIFLTTLNYFELIFWVDQNSCQQQSRICIAASSSSTHLHAPPLHQTSSRKLHPSLTYITEGRLLLTRAMTTSSSAMQLAIISSNFHPRRDQDASGHGGGALLRARPGL
jgi:hypothetical protein